MSVWRERMADLAAEVWTDRKASWPEICEEVLAATGKPVPDGSEDALRHLTDGDVQKVLVSLEIPFEDLSKHGRHDTELCPECFAMIGACEEGCGQREPGQ